MSQTIALAPETDRAIPLAPLPPLPPTMPSIARLNAEGFTLDGSLDLEQHLAHSCRRIAAGVRGIVSDERLEGLLLGGGYGRGEGGVLHTPSGNKPYNDLEFYVFLRGNRHVNELRFGHALHVLGEILTPQVGIEVEFKIASLRELAASPVTMFSSDLVHGHRRLVGDKSLLKDCRHHLDATQIPLSESTRLLMNRGTGLLLAKEKLEHKEFTPADADFVARNIAKAELALGDALLVAHHRYHGSVIERHRRIQQLALAEPGLADVVRIHARAVEFKLHPRRSVASRQELAAQHAALVPKLGEMWFKIESQRLGETLASPNDYVISTRNKWPEAHGLRNAVINLRMLGARSLADGRALRHPRERVLNVMTLLLWEPDALGTPGTLRFIQDELQTDARDFVRIMRAYRELWGRVN